MSAERIIAETLEQFKSIIGADFELYSNHVNRVYLNCILADGSIDNSKKYAIAAIFHDIGIWTNNTFDYLEPSIAQATNYLQNINRQDLIDEVSEMIYWHHKITSYSGKFRSTVENFREADWIDISMGLLRFGRYRKAINRNKKTYPLKGFHLFLLRKSFVNFLSHPLRPLPMFKR